MADNRQATYEVLEDVVLSPEEDAEIQAKIDQAERELDETRVNFRWGREQVAVVKRAAAMAGVPYQTYLKQVVYRQAIQDIQAAQQVNSVLEKAV